MINPQFDAKLSSLQDVARRMERVARKRKPRYLIFETAGYALEIDTGRTIDVATMERVEDA